MDQAMLSAVTGVTGSRRVCSRAAHLVCPAVFLCWEKNGDRHEGIEAAREGVSTQPRWEAGIRVLRTEATWRWSCGAARGYTCG